MTLLQCCRNMLWCVLSCRWGDTSGYICTYSSTTGFVRVRSVTLKKGTVYLGCVLRVYLSNFRLSRLEILFILTVEFLNYPHSGPLTEPESDCKGDFNEMVSCNFCNFALKKEPKHIMQDILSNSEGECIAFVKVLNIKNLTYSQHKRLLPEWSISLIGISS